MATKEKIPDDLVRLVESVKRDQLYADQVWLASIHATDDDPELQSAKKAGRVRAMQAWDDAVSAMAAGDENKALDAMHAAAMGAKVYGSAFYEWRAYDLLDTFYKEAKS